MILVCSFIQSCVRTHQENNQGCLFRSSSSSSSSVAANSHCSVLICFVRAVLTAKYAHTSFFACQKENNKKHIYDVYII